MRGTRGVNNGFRQDVGVPAVLRPWIYSVRVLRGVNNRFRHDVSVSAVLAVWLSWPSLLGGSDTAEYFQGLLNLLRKARFAGEFFVGCVVNHSFSNW